MKKIYIKLTCLMTLSLGIVMLGCNKKNDEVTPSNNSGTVNTNSVDTTLMTHINDTLHAPAGDGSSKSFFGTDHKIHTQKEIDANKSLSGNVAFGYYYDPNNSAYASTIANVGYYSYPLTGWTNANTVFKVVDAGAYNSTTSYTELKNLYDAGTVHTPDGAVYQLAVGEVIAYKTEQDKYGLIKIVNVIPGDDPVNNYIVIDVKMQMR